MRLRQPPSEASVRHAQPAFPWRLLTLLAGLFGVLLLPGSRATAGAGPPPSIAVAVEPASADVGRLVRGTVRLRATGVADPVKLDVGATIKWTDPSGIPASNGPVITQVTIGRDGELALDLATDLPLTVSSSVASQTLEVVAVVRGVSNVRSAASAPLSVASIANPMPAHLSGVRASATPAIAKGGKPVTLVLEYRVRSASAVSFDMKQRVTLARVGAGGAKGAKTIERTERVEIAPPIAEYTPSSSLLDDLTFKPDEPGDYVLMYEVTGAGMVPVSGSVPLRVDGYARTKGRLVGKASVAWPVIKPNGTQLFEVEYKMIDGPDQAVVVEAAELIWAGGPAESIQHTETIRPEDTNRSFSEGTGVEEGIYTYRFTVSGDDIQEWVAEAKFEVRKDSGASPTPTPAATPTPASTGNAQTGTPGTWGLIAKAPGRAASSVKDPQGWTYTASLSEGAFSCAMTPDRPDTAGYRFNASGSWTAPPAVLKPGEVIELACSVSGSVGDRGSPGVTLDFEAEGFEIVENQDASIYYKGNDWIGSSKGGIKLKVPEGSSYDIKVWQDLDGFSFGSDGAWYGCEYVFRWNAPPIDHDPGDDSGDEEGEYVPLHWVNSGDEEDRCTLVARLDQQAITLYAGESSEIVHLAISGFRRNTDARVEVIFPEEAGGWGSLPGQIVVACGGGSYWPPIMNAPEHSDGYFFSARRTAPTSDQVIEFLVRQEGCPETVVTLDVHVVGKPQETVGVFGGEWETDFGYMALTQSGDEVTGGYESPEGEIAGKVIGNTLRFTWIQADRKGSGKFILSEDGNSISGQWSHSVDPEAPPEGFWRGQRILD